MSYSFNIQLSATDGVEDLSNKYQHAFDEYVRPGAVHNDVLAETEEACAIQYQLALQYIGTLPASWETISLSLSGHCNKGFTAQPGWANDCRSTYINVLTYKEVA